MRTLSDFPLQELLDDRAATIGDIQLCQVALAANIHTYGENESTQLRLDKNKEILTAIDGELGRRKQVGELE